MDEIVRMLSTPAIIAAIEANFAEEMAAFGRHLPGAELHEEAEMRWFYTGLSTSGFNGVLHTHITGDDIDAKIDNVIAYFSTRLVPFSWAIGPTTLPINLAHYLKARGFTHIHDGTGMAADLQTLPEAIATPANFRVAEVSDIDMLQTYSTTSMKGFSSTEEYMRIYSDTYRAIGFAENSPWHHYIGWLNDEPVGVSSLLLHAGVAGIYGVATVPEARRLGIGSAMTLAPLREARRRGYRVGVLSPSEMGLSVYKRLGFRTYCTMSFYRLAPENRVSGRNGLLHSKRHG